MRVLVTGANGFLGRHVVAALTGGGHSVRALVRASTRLEGLGWGDDVEVFRADLRNHGDLSAAFQNVDAVIHLAAAMAGGDFNRFSDTVVGSERFFRAMAESPVKRLLLCSSFSVYDWLQSHGRVDESLPLLSDDVYHCGGYAAAKLWQERMARRMADENHWDLTVLRPGFIWGPGNECPASSIGRSLGSFHLVFAGLRQPPFTHVANTADCFRAALENPNSVGTTLNVVDNHGISAWEFMGEYLHRSGRNGVRVFLPYWLMRGLAGAIQLGSRWLLGPRAKLPSLFVPERFAQGYRPLQYSNARLREVLDWTPPLDYPESLQQCFSGTEAGAR